MAFYEHVLIARPDMSPAQAEAMVEELEGYFKEQGAEIGRKEYWGLRNLSYPINKQRKGHYALFNVSVDASAIQELERRHRLSDDVIRYMTVKVDGLSAEPSPIIARKESSSRRRD